jgi:hypothetical protein
MQISLLNLKLSDSIWSFGQNQDANLIVGSSHLIYFLTYPENGEELEATVARKVLLGNHQKSQQQMQTLHKFPCSL